jgi:NYN domain
MPDNAYDPHGYAAARRHETAWRRSDPRVILTSRNLRYPENYVHGRSKVSDVREKGIDVALALDLVTMATDDAYDLGIVMSCDHDLAPALERVIARRATRGEGPEVAVTSWKKDYGKSPRMWVTKGHSVFCHWLDRDAYWGVIDERNYGQPTPADFAPRR